MISIGWWYTYPSEEYEFVSWDDEIPNMWKPKKCSKPPASLNWWVVWTYLISIVKLDN